MPIATGWTFIRYSSIRPSLTNAWTVLAPPKITRSLPGSCFSLATSSAMPPAASREFLIPTFSRVFENTTFGVSSIQLAKSARSAGLDGSAAAAGQKASKL